MDLMSLTARLFLDSGDFESGLAGAEQSADSFAARLDSALEFAQSAATATMGALAGASGGWGRDMMDGYIGGILSMTGRLRQAVSGAAATVKAYLGFSEPEEGPLSDFHTYAPDMVKLFAQGITDSRGLISDAIGGAFALPGPGLAQAAAPARQAIDAPRAEGFRVIREAAEQAIDAPRASAVRTVRAAAEPFDVPRAESFRTVRAPAGEAFDVPRALGGQSIQAATMEIDRAVFARLVFRLYNEEASRVGVKLSKGVL